MVQLAAYAIQPPAPINVGAIEAQAQENRLRDYQLQAAPGELALKNAQMAGAVQEQNAINTYHTDSANGDQAGALDALKGYPDHFKAMATAFDGMSPDQWKATSDRASAFGRAAQAVSAYADGSPQQKSEWDNQIAQLQQQGFIDKQTHDAMIAQGPNRQIINEALQADEYVKKYGASQKMMTPLDQSRIDLNSQRANTETLKQQQIQANMDSAAQKQAAADAGQLSPKDKISLERTITEATTAMRRSGSTDDEVKTEEKRLRRQYGLEKPAGTATDPFTPQSRDDVQGLPQGAYFVTPDGTLMRKK